MALLATLAWLLASGAIVLSAPASDLDSNPGITYNNYRDAKIPLSIHVIRVTRHSSQFQIRSRHAKAEALGLSTVTDQTDLHDAAASKVIAAINGDFYERRGLYAGDPRGLQIVDGELLSAPSETASFWIDFFGEPHIDITIPSLMVTWPDGNTTPIGLNGSREASGLQLYTPSLGKSTHTTGGRELVLEATGTRPPVPLRPGRTYRLRIRELRESGDTQIPSDAVVLSLGPALHKIAMNLSIGSEVVITTATSPNLLGTRAAISGGPILVRNGKTQRIRVPDSDSYEFRSMLERHPRSAIGWNEDLFFLVQVDGRAKGWSVGMTLKELGEYLVELGCQEAMNLDGGGSATLWFNGKVVNRPCDGFERPVANSLVVLRMEPKETANKP